MFQWLIKDGTLSARAFLTVCFQSSGSGSFVLVSGVEPQGVTTRSNSS